MQLWIGDGLHRLNALFKADALVDLRANTSLRFVPCDAVLHIFWNLGARHLGSDQVPEAVEVGVLVRKANRAAVLPEPVRYQQSWAFLFNLQHRPQALVALCFDGLGVIQKPKPDEFRVDGDRAFACIALQTLAFA